MAGGAAAPDGRTPRDHQRLIIEITETAAIQDLDQSIKFVDTLRELGCRVAIDDFGAGYTSFRNLKLLNVDMVKIDGAFVKDLADDTSDQIFIRTMIELAQTFGMETVAEWVGDEEPPSYLKNAGITYLQGFYYGLPIEVDELTRRRRLSYVRPNKTRWHSCRRVLLLRDQAFLSDSVFFSDSFSIFCCMAESCALRSLISSRRGASPLGCAGPSDRLDLRRCPASWSAGRPRRRRVHIDIACSNIAMFCGPAPDRCRRRRQDW